MSAVRMFKVINHNPEVIRGKYDGHEYVFEPEKPVFISFDAAKHIFGLGSKDKSQALNQLGWLVPGRDTYADALKKIDMVSFLEGRVVYPTEEEAAAEDAAALAAEEAGEDEPGSAPHTHGPGGGRRPASRSKSAAANPS